MALEPAIRFARPVRSAGGSWTVDGWAVSKLLDDWHEPGRWSEILLAGRALHAAVAGMPPPPFQAQRRDPWALGDRAAWGELEVAVPGPLRNQVSALVALLRPVDEPGQLVHGDLCGNALFGVGLPPAVLDFSPFFRPVSYAEAILVTDAVIWEGAPPALVGQLRGENVDQMMVRACLFRLYAAAVAWPHMKARLSVIAGHHEPFTRYLQDRMSNDHST